MDAVCPCWLKKLVEKRGKGGGGDPFAQGWTHTDRRIRRFFSKTGGKRSGCVLFGHRASRAQPQQLQRWRVEMCICEWWV